MAERTHALAIAFLRGHPREAAGVLTGHSAQTIAEALAGDFGKAGLGELGALLQAMPPSLAADVLARWPEESLGKALASVPDDELPLLLGIPSALIAKRLLDALPARRAAAVRRTLSYPPDSIGRHMRRRALTLPTGIEAGNARTLLKQEGLPPGDVAFVLDAHRRVRGQLPLATLAAAAADDMIDALLEPVTLRLKASQSLFAVRELAEWRRHARLPVVDGHARFVGVLAHADVLRPALDEESTLLDPATESDLLGGLLHLAEAVWIPLARLFAAAASGASSRSREAPDDGRR